MAVCVRERESRGRQGSKTKRPQASLTQTLGDRTLVNWAVGVMETAYIPFRKFSEKLNKLDALVINDQYKMLLI